jgi:signal transduction histidine kinase
MHNKIKFFLGTTRFRTTIWYSSLFLLLEILIGIIIYWYLHSSLIMNIDNSISKQADVIYNLVSDSKIDLADFEPDSIYQSADEAVYDLIYESVAFNTRNTFVQVQFKNKIRFKTDNLRDSQIDFPLLKAKNKEIITFQNPDLSASAIRGAFLQKGDYKIVVAFPVDHIKETLQSFTDIFIIIAPIFFIIAVVGGFLISVGSLSRIDFITKKTNEITAQNLNEKIEGEEFQDEYGRLVRTINAMIERIKHSIEYTNQFSISASHELKTPLTILRGEIELTLKSEKTPEEYRKILKSNYEETLRLINIVDKLFLISKLDQSIIKPNKTKVDLLEFLEDCVLRLTILGKGKNIKLNLDLNEDAEIDIDPNLMNEALTNLIENAVKYGDSDTTVTIKGEVSNEYIKISVINKGEGIPKDETCKIFERFYRVESSRNRDAGGAGLGLAIVKSIVNWHNGKIELHSEPNAETDFSIYLTRLPEQQQTVAT